MWVIKKCKCGSTNFYNDEGTMRCEECSRVADLAYIPDKEESEDEND